MSDQTVRGFVALAADQIDKDGKQWIEIMPTATKARNGPFYFTITADDLQVYADYIAANPDRIPVDYDHEGAEGGSSVAAGWFTGQAEVRDGDAGPTLWAEVEWTPQAQDELQHKRFRFISPEWSMKLRDAKTGLLTKAKELKAATLTNRPFFRELAPVASILWSTNEGFESLRQKVSQAVNPASASESRYWIMDITTDRALIQEYGAQKTWVAAFTQNGDGTVSVDPSSAWTEAQQGWVAAAAQALQHHLSRKPFSERNDMDTTVLAKSLGLAEDADETAIAAAIKARDDKIVELETQVAEFDATKTETEKLREELNEVKAQRDTDRKETLIAKAINDRQALPVQKELMETWSIEQIEAYIEKTPTAVFKETGSGGNAKEDDPKVDDTIRASFTSGTDQPDDDSLDLHVRAEKILADAGKATGYSDDDYAAALDQASRETKTPA